MLLTLTTTHRPATDLGHLLRKNPARAQVFELSFGKAHVFYPEAGDERCTVALLVEVDPVGLVRNRRGPAGEGGLLENYVNDRPYAASSFLSVALADVFSSALEDAAENLHFDRLPPLQKERLKLLHGSLLYRDERLAGFGYHVRFLPVGPEDAAVGAPKQMGVFGTNASPASPATCRAESPKENSPGQAQ